MQQHSSYIGQVLANQYKIENLVGEGRMGQVFKVYDLEREQVLALKLLDTRQKKLPLEAIVRFQAEADTLKSLRHPNIVKYIDFFDAEGIHGMVMEYLPLPTLTQSLQDVGTFSIDNILQVITKITEALAFIHKKGIVHHDLKSSNILVSIKAMAVAEVKLLDFGLAHIINSGLDNRGGTLAYMAPEQTGILQKTIDHRADLYSLGIILYEILAGKLPFQEEDPSLLIHQHIAQTPAKPSIKRHNVPVILEDILFKLLSKDPNDRYRTTLGLLNDLNKYVRLGNQQQTVIHFPIAEEDHWEGLPITMPFIGRDRALSTAAKIIAQTTPMIDENEQITAKIAPKNPLAECQALDNTKGGVLLIEGSKGIGKSSFLNELYNSAQGQAGQSWLCQLQQVRVELPYQGLKTLFSQLERQIANLDAVNLSEVVEMLRYSFANTLDMILELIPTLKKRRELTTIQHGQGDWSSKVYRDAIAELLSRIAQTNHRLVIFIDNFQAIDNLSASILYDTIIKAQKCPLLMVLAYSPLALSGEQRTWIERFTELKQTERIYLGPLSEVDHDQLLQQLLSAKLYDLPILLTPIYNASSGNPMMTRNLLNSLVDKHALYYKDQRWQLDQKAALAIINHFNASPIKDNPIIDWEPQQQLLLKRCAIFTHRFCWEMVEKVIAVMPIISLNAEQSLSTLDKAVHLGVLSIDVSMSYVFQEPKVREYLGNLIPEEEKRNLHHNAAIFLQNMLPQEPASMVEIARHWEHAGHQIEAFESYLSAAERSNNHFNNSQAEIYYRLALQCLSQLDPNLISGEKHFNVRYQSIRYAAFTSEEYDKLWQETEELSDWIANTKSRQLQYLDLKSFLSFLRGDMHAAIEFSQQVVSLGTQPEDEIYVLDAYGRLGELVSDKNYEERAKLLEHCLQISVRHKIYRHAHSLIILSVMLAYLGRFQEAENKIAQTSKRFHEQDYPGAFILRDFSFMLLEIERGDFRRALQLGEAISTDHKKMGNLTANFYESCIARCYGMQGLYKEALQRFDQLLQEKDKAEQHIHFLNTLLGRVQVAIKMQEYEQVLDFLEQAHQYLEYRPDPYMDVMFAIFAGAAYIELNQISKAREALENEAQPIVDQLQSPLLYAHLNFYLAKLHWLQTRDKRFIEAAEQVTADMLNMELTGYFEIYKSDLNTWAKKPSSSSMLFSSFLTKDKDILTLVEVNREITSTLDVDKLLKIVLEGAMKIIGAEHGYLFTCPVNQICNLDAQGDIPCLRFTRNALRQTIPEQDYIYSISIVKQVVQEQETIITRNARHEKQWKTCDSIHTHELRSILAAPIIVHGQVKGIIYLDNHQATSVFNLRDKEIVEIFATQAAIAMNNAENYAKEQAARAQSEATLKMFKRFVPTQFIESIAKGDINTLERGLAKQENLTILFSDIRDFTAISENMPPEDVFYFLNSYLRQMDTPIRRNNGFVDKFIGDAIMALFDKTPADAVNAGLEMIMRLLQYNSARMKRGDAIIQIGIGINTGDVTIGVVGSKTRMDTTVLGDAVNIAARIESLTQTYRCPLIISGETYRHIENNDSFLVRFIDRVQVKGKRAPTELYEVFNHDPVSIQARKQRYQTLLQDAYQAYSQGQWQQSEKLFRQYRQFFPEDLIVTPFLERCKTYLALPPRSWQGIFKLEQK